MANYDYYKSLEDEEGGSQQAASGENPAASWISRVEDPNSVVNQYGTDYGTAENPVVRGKINPPVARNVDQWGNDLPEPTRAAKTLNSVYKTLSNWQEYLTGKGSSADNPYVNPQWGKENIRTVRDIMGVAPAKSIGMK